MNRNNYNSLYALRLLDMLCDLSGFMLESKVVVRDDFYSHLLLKNQS